jgi:outer membrane protein assembly factor BamB
MTRFLEHIRIYGGLSLYAAKRSLRRPAILILLLTVFLITGCGSVLTNENWPGLVASGDRAYVSFGPGIYAVDVPAREAVWSFPEGFEGRGQIYAPLSIFDGRIIVGDFGQAGGMFSPGPTVTIYALDEATGEASASPMQRWANDAVARDKIVAQASQSAAAGFVGTGDNDIIALDADSGQELWRFETGHSIWGQPVYDNGVVYAPSLDMSVYALDAETGSLIWQTTFEGSIASSPVLSEDTVYVGSYDHQLHALDRATGEVKWSSSAENLVWGAPALGDGHVYFGDIDGNVYAVTTSGEPVWQQRAGGLIQTAPIYHDGVVYVVSGSVTGDEEELVGEVLALNAEDGREIWRTATPSPILTSPVVIGEELVVAPLKYSALLLVYDLENGALVWEFVPPSGE